MIIIIVVIRPIAPVRSLCLQCFDAVGWAAGRASACKNRVVGCWRGYLCGARCRLAYGPFSSPQAATGH